MNGYEDPSLSSGVFSYNSHTNGHGSASPEPHTKAKSSAKAIYEQRKHFTKTSINSLTDTSQYHVEHLTTFVLDRKDGMVTVDDGVRRLRLLNAKGKVWTQEMLLQVEEKSVSLIDLETKNELENFPVSTLQLCQSVMSVCSFDSILALVCKEPGQTKPDLHLFQCDDIKANLIALDIESAMSDAKAGRVKRRPEALKIILKSDGVIPPPPAAPAPEPPAANHIDVKSRAAAWSAWSNEQQDYENRRYLSEEDVPMEMTAARIDRDVQILNHILDDIEFLVTKLQKSSEAFNELNRRRKVKKGKKRGPGEGVLTLRSKPPAEEEVVDCLQKFKHAFNQLGKLKDHIQNPSAVELLHFLFTPLRMVIHASSVELARSVVVPLLSGEAIDFLHSSGSAEERHLWVTMGDGWTKCRLEWPKDHYFPSCPLRFRDGWEPPSLPSFPNRDMELTQLAASLANAEDMRFRMVQESAVQPFPPTDGYAAALSNSSYKRMQILDQNAAMLDYKHGRHSDRSFDADSRVQPKVFAKSKYDFVARNSTELSVLKDEVVEVLDDRKQWWKVGNGIGTSGYVPNNILEITKAVDITGRGEPIYSHTIQLMMPKKEFELFKQLLGELNEKQTTRTDFMPSNKPVVTQMPPEPPPAPTRLPTPPLPPPANEPIKTPGGSIAAAHVSSRHNSTASSDNGSVAMRDHSNQRPPFDRRKSNMEEVQDELMHRLTLGRSAQKKIPPRGSVGNMAAGSHIAPGSITYDSSPDDVRGWLEAKGFSPVTITSLGVLTGAQLFSLNKEELKTVCPDDGARVFSQVTVQKAALELLYSRYLHQQAAADHAEFVEIMRRRQEMLGSPP